MWRKMQETWRVRKRRYTNNNNQNSNNQIQMFCLDIWLLKIIWDLEFGYWDLDYCAAIIIRRCE